MKCHIICSYSLNAFVPGEVSGKRPTESGHTAGKPAWLRRPREKASAQMHPAVRRDKAEAAATASIAVRPPALEGCGVFALEI
ncbi:MAG: hypothetical protein FWH02_01070 [Oscillospiraceae bacterium]|nr:hypothetical protein [Oscillospiraceae bacterium]